ncbi:MAG: hypothetical protein U1E47_08310 [Rivihabitans pingtungensis]
MLIQTAVMGWMAITRVLAACIKRVLPAGKLERGDRAIGGLDLMDQLYQLGRGAG